MLFTMLKENPSNKSGDSIGVGKGVGFPTEIEIDNARDKGVVMCWATYPGMQRTKKVFWQKLMYMCSDAVV